MNQAIVMLCTIASKLRTTLLICTMMLLCNVSYSQIVDVVVQRNLVYVDPLDSVMPIISIKNEFGGIVLRRRLTEELIEELPNGRYEVIVETPERVDTPEIILIEINQ